MSDLDRKYVVRNRLRIRMQTLLGSPPIVIYTMGKTGSSSVLAALEEAQLSNPAYQVHILSHGGIEEFTSFYDGLKPPIWPQHMNASAALRPWAGGRARTRWKIITLVRDPIAVRLSAFFENLALFHPEMIGTGGELHTDAALTFMRKTLANYPESTDLIDRYFRTWFASEFKEGTGIDILQHPFDSERGFTLIKEPLADVLVIRYENLRQCFSDAICTLLGIEGPIELPQVNVGQTKPLGDAYAYVRDHVEISAEACTRIYANREVTHFYTPEMIEGFVARWAKVR